MSEGEGCMQSVLGGDFKICPHEKLFFVILILLSFLLLASGAQAVDIPGQDFSRDLETLGSIAQTGDTIAFGWIRPFCAGVFLIIGCIGLVRSNFMLLATGFGAAVVILLVPKIIKEISKKGGSSIFSISQPVAGNYRYV
jgi:hypothetical protein